MSVLYIDIESADRISESFSGSAGWTDKDSLRIIFITNGVRDEHEATQLIKDALEKKGRDWFEYTDESWILKADIVRRDINRPDRFAWLTGRLPVKPVFSEQPIDRGGVSKGPTVSIEVAEP